MDETRRIAKMFALDIINYKKLGGNLNNLTASNVYNLIKGKECIDDFSELDKEIKELESLNDKDKDAKLILMHENLKNNLKKDVYFILFNILRTKEPDFNKLSIKKKTIFIKEGYKYMLTHN